MPQKPGRKLGIKSIKMQQRLCLHLVALIFLHLTAISQDQKFVKKYSGSLKPASKTYSIDYSKGYTSAQNGVGIYLPASRTTETSLFMSPIGNSGAAPEPKSKIYQYQYFNPGRDWGIICQKEWKLEKTTGIPFRFRLGSLEYVDRLEGKAR